MGCCPETDIDLFIFREYKHMKDRFLIKTVALYPIESNIRNERDELTVICHDHLDLSTEMIV